MANNPDTDTGVEESGEAEVDRFEPVLVPYGMPTYAERTLNPSGERLWRLFVAIQLSGSVKSELDVMSEDVWRPRRDGGPSSYLSSDVRWTDRDNLHLTLKYIGDVDPEHVSRLREAMTEISSESSNLNLQLGDNGCFPGPRTPRVLWTGLRGDVRRMASLVAKLEGAFALRGIERETRDFMPHITVGRVRGGLPRYVLSGIGNRWLDAKPDERSSSIPVDRIVLMRSHLRERRPPRYERLFSAKIG